MMSTLEPVAAVHFIDGNAGPCPTPAVRDTRRDRLNWVMGWTPPDGICAKVTVANCHQKEASMEQATTIGLDIAKHVFQVHGADAAGHVSTVLRARFG